jgi:tetratricopeptide (TPR) repeat protein
VAAKEGAAVKGRGLILLCAALLFAGMSVVENRAVQSRPAEPADRVSSVYQLAGEFRVVFANLLWIKADKYHHEYIQHDPNWCNNRDLLGLFKMITALDPRFTEAYSTGTYILMYGYHNRPKALAYLKQGLTANPRSMELNELAAVLYAQKLKDPETALPYAQRAVRFAPDDFYRTVARRTLRSIERMAKEGS